MDTKTRTMAKKPAMPRQGRPSKALWILSLPPSGRQALGRLLGTLGAIVALTACLVSTACLIRLSAITPVLSFVPRFPTPDIPMSIFPAKAMGKNSSRPAAPPVARPEDVAAPFVCDESHPYRIEIISASPLVIYIHNFTSAREAAALVRAGEPLLAPSRVDQPGGHRQVVTARRTSTSAGLPRDDPTVACMLRRARRAMGPGLFRDGWDDVGPPQLVRYAAGQRFDLHSDWWGVPRAAADGSGRGWNRLASFLVGLQDNCTGGETYFPFVAPPVAPGLGGEADEGVLETEDQEMMRRWTGREPVWRRHPKGGVAFRPVAGNAVFWVNLHANGTGDTRTKHAGLPIGEGLKTAMNIWPRQYYP
ncbi:hypothetical protein RB595_004983 [Gaeumannomyces hyphopodioides]